MKAFNLQTHYRMFEIIFQWFYITFKILFYICAYLQIFGGLLAEPQGLLAEPQDLLAKPQDLLADSTIQLIPNKK